MSESSIKQRCKNIRSQVTNYQAQKQRELATFESPKYHSLRLDADELLYQIYRALVNDLNLHCSFDPQFIFKIPIPQHEELDYVLRESCGLPIITNQQNSTVKIDLSGAGKVCEILRISENGEPKTTILDFPDLIGKFLRQNQLWEDNLPKIAKICLKRLKVSLENLPERIYGIPESINIQSSSATQNSTFQLGKVQKVYANLRPNEAGQLVSAMDRYIQGGGFNLYEHTSSMQLVLIRYPERVIANPVFDYNEFCQTYDAVTPELEQVFDKIAKDMSPLPPKEHLRRLRYQRVLFYWFDSDADFINISEGLDEGRQHSNAFLEFISQKFQVKATGMIFVDEKGDFEHLNPGHKYLQISYELKPGQSDPSCDPHMTPQEVQTAITEIYTTKVPEMSTHLATWILNEVEKNIKEEGLKEITTPKHSWRIPREIPQLKINNFDIDLTATEPDLRKEIQKTIAYQTSGLIQIDMSLRRYTLAF